MPGRRPLLAALAGALVVLGAGWSVLPGRAGDGPEASIELATGGTKGVYYAYGRTLAAELQSREPGVRAWVVETTGSVDNLRRVADGSAAFAFTAGDAAAQAWQGGEPFSAPVPIRAVARVYDDYVHLVVPAGSPIRSVEDLAGRRVSVGSPGSGTAFIAARLLSVAGVPARRVRAVELGINESVGAMRAGSLDAFFWSGGLPTGGVAELAAAAPVRLVALGDLAEGMRDRYGSSYRSATVPAGMYGGSERVATIAVPNLVVCREDADPLLVERLLATLFGARETLGRTVPQAEALDERAAVATFPVPLHPGAERYFRAVKL